MRKTKLITIESDNRDNGKSYLITEMSASQVEKWAAKAFFALAKSGFEIPDEQAEKITTVKLAIDYATAHVKA